MNKRHTFTAIYAADITDVFLTIIADKPIGSMTVTAR